MPGQDCSLEPRPVGEPENLGRSERTPDRGWPILVNDPGARQDTARQKGQQVTSPASDQIIHEHEPSRSVGHPGQQRDRVVVSQVMKEQGAAKHVIIRRKVVSNGVQDEEPGREASCRGPVTGKFNRLHADIAAIDQYMARRGCRAASQADGRISAAGSQIEYAERSLLAAA